MFRKNMFCLLTIMVLSASVGAGCKNTTENIIGKEKSSEQTVSNPGSVGKGEENEKKTLLLLGLSHDVEAGKQDIKLINRLPDEFRSLIVYNQGKELEKKELKGSLVTPYGDKFFELRNEDFLLKQENSENNEEDFFLKYNYYFNSNNIVSSVLGQKRTPLFTDTTFKEKYKPEEADFPFKNIIEWPWFIGNKYACIMNDEYMTGGGTMRFGRNEIRLFDIGSLGKLENRDKTKKLFDLLDKDVQQELLKFAEKKNKEFQGQQQEPDSMIKGSNKVDLDNLSMIRKMGKWILQIPVYGDYHHEGNGSTFYNVTEYIPYECKLPVSLTGYDNLCVAWNQVLKAVPQAVDAFSSPLEDLLLVTTSDELMIFKDPKEGLEKPELTVPLAKNERVVLNQWAVGEFADKWRTELGKYFK